MESQFIDWKEIALANRNIKAKKLLERKAHIAKRSAHFKEKHIKIYKRQIGDYFQISYSTEYIESRGYYQNGVLHSLINGINVTFAICDTRKETPNKQVALDLIYVRDVISEDRFNIFISSMERGFLKSEDLHTLILVHIGKRISVYNENYGYRTFDFDNYNKNLATLFEELIDGNIGCQAVFEGK